MPKSIKVPSFVGHNNLRKVEVFVWLYHFGGDRYYTARQLSRYTVIPVKRLRSRLYWYFHHGHLQMKAIITRKGPRYGYRLSKRGKWFTTDVIPVRRHQRILKQYQEQAKQEQKNISDMIKRVLEDQGIDDLADDD